MVAYRGSVRKHDISATSVLEHHDERRRVMDNNDGIKVVLTKDSYMTACDARCKIAQIEALVRNTDRSYVDKDVLMAILMIYPMEGEEKNETA